MTMVRRKQLTSLLVGTLLGTAAALASPAEAGKVSGVAKDATASTTYGTAERRAVGRLFDGDPATTWCGSRKVKDTVTLALGESVPLTVLTLSLGNASAWKDSPRVKQVIVTVREGDRTVKKIRHKWPDHDEPSDGTVNLGAPGDNVLVEFDKVYAGATPRALCVGELGLEGVDTAAVALAGMSDEERLGAVMRSFTSVREGDGANATLAIKRGGVFTFAASDLRVSGRWSFAAAPGTGTTAKTILRFTPQSSVDGSKRLTVPAGLATHDVPMRHGAGTPPVPVPWLSYANETGALALAQPVEVQPE